MGHMTKDEIITRLEILKVTRVYAEYSGGNDDGGIDYMDATFASGETKEQDPYSHWPARINKVTGGFQDGPRTQTQEDARIWGAIAELHGYGNFAFEFRTSGTIKINVEEKTIKINGRDLFEQEYPYAFSIDEPEHNTETPSLTLPYTTSESAPSSTPIDPTTGKPFEEAPEKRNPIRKINPTAAKVQAIGRVS